MGFFTRQLKALKGKNSCATQKCKKEKHWLCIRSNASKEDGDGLAFGHANLTLYTGTDINSATATTYGTWPDSHEEIQNQGLDNKWGSDIRVNFDGDDPSNHRGYKYVHCREISDEQLKKLQKIVSEGSQWGYFNNCSSFASQTFYKVTGVDIDADDTLGIETPREIGKSIVQANNGSPSNFGGTNIPIAPGYEESSSSSSF